MRALLAGLLATTAFLVNCNPFSASFDYGENEMKAAVEGKWTLDHGGKKTAIEIREATKPKQHASASLIAPAAACGNQSFIAEAAACTDVSRMELVATAAGQQVLTGELLIVGTHFDSGEVEMKGDGFLVTARITPDGKVTSADGLTR